jgi:diaminopimelate decarboxylase
MQDPAQVSAAARAGVGRFVVSTGEHIAALAACTDRRTRLVVDLRADTTALVPAILAQRHLEIIGLQHRLTVYDADPLGMQAIRDAVGEMARLRRVHGVLLTHICLDGLDLGDWAEMPRVLRHLDAALNDAAGAGCEHHRYPRPVVSVTPCESSFLLPTRPASSASRRARPRR